MAVSLAIDGHKNGHKCQMLSSHKIGHFCHCAKVAGFAWFNHAEDKMKKLLFALVYAYACGMACAEPVLLDTSDFDRLVPGEKRITARCDAYIAEAKRLAGANDGTLLYQDEVKRAQGEVALCIDVIAQLAQIRLLGIKGRAAAEKASSAK